MYEIVYQVGYWETLYALGICIGFGSSVWLMYRRAARNWKDRGWLHKAFYFPFQVAWGLATIAMAAMFLWMLWEVHEMRRSVLSKEVEVLEGRVHILRQEPRGGHVGGEMIEVMGRRIVYSNYDGHPGYHTVSVRGGVLQEGRWVRLSIWRGRIARIELPIDSALPSEADAK